jgi:hypothetical protein
MQQTFRRQLLALGTLSNDGALAAAQCRAFIASVLAADISRRPSIEGVRDVLQSNRAPAAAVDRFVANFEAAVWPPLGQPATASR